MVGFLVILAIMVAGCAESGKSGIGASTNNQPERAPAAVETPMPLVTPTPAQIEPAASVTPTPSPNETEDDDDGSQYEDEDAFRGETYLVDCKTEIKLPRVIESSERLVKPDSARVSIDGRIVCTYLAQNDEMLKFSECFPDVVDRDLKVVAHHNVTVTGAKVRKVEFKKKCIN